MTDEKRKKVLERIRKLHAMSGDVSSPNEAAIAARRMKALMDEYQVSEAEVLTARLTLESILEETHGGVHRKIPKHWGVLAVAVAQYTDCRAYIATISFRPRLDQIKFVGEANDLEICKYIWTYLTRTIDDLAKKSPIFGRSGHNNFKYGAVLEISATLRKLKAQDLQRVASTGGKAMVLLEKKLLLIREKYGPENYGKSNRNITDALAFNQGRAEGSKVSIHKGLENDANDVRKLT